MYVAKSKQKPPENAFQMRARLKAESEAAEAAKRAKAAPAPAPVDLEAIREAAARAAALVHGSAHGPEHVESSGHEPVLIAVDGGEQFSDAEESKRGRPKSSAAEERANRVLGLVTRSGEDGATKAALVEATGENPPNVNTSLQRLKDDGKIESRSVEGSKALRWFAV